MLITVPDKPHRKGWRNPSTAIGRLKAANLAKAGVKRTGVNDSLSGALFGATDPKYFLEREKPVHRQMQELATMGYCAREIAQLTGYSPTHVATVLQQPYAQANMIQTMKQRVEVQLKELLESEAIPSVRRLVHLRENAASDAVQKAACDSLLDRYLGRPTQPVTHEEKPASQMTTDELRSQVERIVGGMEPTAEDTQQPGPVGTDVRVHPGTASQDSERLLGGS